MPRKSQALPPFPVLPGRFSRDPFHDGISGIVAGDLSLDVTNPFVAIHERFEGLLTDSAEVRVVAKQEGRAFAHEAGVWVEETQEVWFTSNLYSSGSNVTVEVSKFHCSSHEVQKVTVPHVKVGNGACRSTGGIVFCEQGGLDSHSELVLVDVSGAEPKSRVLLNNFQGRRFNSLNDVIAHPSHFNSLWFTDPTYGHEQGFRPDPQLPPQVYEFNTTTGAVRVVADGFDHPNGICFSPDGTRCYITDTGHIHGSGRKDPTKPSTIYAYDVMYDNETPSMHSRRIFAFADCGVPDGIKCDKLGNVYAGCGDGIHIWSPGGTLLGKIILGFADNNVGAGCANFCFIPGGRMVCFSEDRIYMVTGLAVEGAGL